MYKTGYVYVIINKINGKYYYGKTFCIENRWNKHILNANKKINRKLYDAMNHYGYENFSIHQIKEIIDIKENIVDKLNNAEIYFVKFSMSNNSKFGYNMTNGGEGGDTFTNHPNKKEIIEKRRKANSGKKRSKEFCELMKKITKNIDPEIRKKGGKKAAKNRLKRIQEKGYTEKELIAQKKNKERLVAYNKSPEGRKRVSEQFKGKKKKPFTEEHKKNIGKASKGRKIPGKKILINNIEYESLHDANRKLQIPLMTIRNRLINKNFPNYVYLS
jgi:group I intron endonuclease